MEPGLFRRLMPTGQIAKVEDTRYRFDVSRLFDITVSLALLLFLAPLIFVVALLVWINLGRPLLFRQVRPGLHGVPFTLIKFRTMRQPAAAVSRESDAVRLGRFGKVIRAMSLDELPSLWNVLRGDMSLIGPRPLLMEYLPLYTAEQMRRHEVRPGITGWAQVNGRNAVSWEEKFELDVWYVDNQSLRLDAKILGMTLIKVLKSEGVNQPGCATAERFKGTQVE